MKILGCPHLWIIWLITQGVILLYLLTAYTVSIASRPFCQVKEMLEAPEVIRRKQDDHHASHSNGINQFLHLLSSSTFIYCYILAFYDLTTAMCLGLAVLFVRQ